MAGSAPRRAGLLGEGLALFNTGKFFDAHQTWELAWRSSAGDLRVLLQGLIQAAAALLHLQRGNLRGAKMLYVKASAKLDSLRQEEAGLALGEFRDELGAFFSQAAEGRVTSDFPRLRRKSLAAASKD